MVTTPKELQLCRTVALWIETNRAYEYSICVRRLLHPLCAMSLKDRMILWIGPPLISFVLRLVGLTLRVRKEGTEGRFPEAGRHQGTIYAAWHSRLVLGVYLCRGSGVNVLTSQSRDGELLARTITRFGYATTRGSSSRGAIGSLKGVARVVADGGDVMIAPDGPRGPRERAKEGAILIASLTGAPIVPWSWCGSRMKVLKSWDQLRIPMPFSRCWLVGGNSIEVPKGCSREQLESKRVELENELHRLAELEKEVFPS